MKGFIKTFFAVVWFLIMVILFIIAAFGKVSKSAARFGFFGVIGWLTVTIVVFVIYDRISTKRKQKKDKEYNEKYVTLVELEDDLLGKMKFSCDSNTKQLQSIELRLPPFGAAAPETLDIIDIAEEKRERCVKAVRAVYAHKDEILDLICAELSETAAEYGETDENGNEYTPETLREALYVIDIMVCETFDGFTVSLDCSVTRGSLELGGHGFIANVNFDKKTIDYELAG